MEYIELGPSPCDEECVQVGTENYASLAMEECRRYKTLLEKMYGATAKNGRGSFSIKGFPHDFGRYFEVVVNFDDDESAEWAYQIESNLPAKWE